ncbi:hypothetical protein SAMD00019534_040650 [Acytostelium subglobosum LB1]|uniref:hypothetical protein n=1 Tax=Acytostelium subglobosum LB1 TaxID=1410327 RepID=UPI000644BE24|nr:hypothetical protein SAMD00019534_040650 [Acytostelium subglobosum LB1]GAM20890.1 hypothetical protein SAMD00019534_040650 [Acytostelium subglobosum LB1]|eukprot:XP_012756024.1 hypothetical protein SAMD00019534_040650 [Acytostelium subglobosum LB1]
MLSTVSKQFHQAVSSVMSNTVIPELFIGCTIKHIGSTHCLFKSPPLHIKAENLDYIPKEHLETCLDRLESLEVPINLLEYRRIGLIKIRAPNAKHIKFVDGSTKCVDSHWTESGTTSVGVSKFKRNPDRHCYDKFFAQLFQSYINQNNSDQWIEIVSRSPIGPPSLPRHFKGRFSFTMDLSTNRMASFDMFFESDDESDEDYIDMGDYSSYYIAPNPQLVTTLIVRFFFDGDSMVDQFPEYRML